MIHHVTSTGMPWPHVLSHSHWEGMGVGELSPSPTGRPEVSIRTKKSRDSSAGAPPAVGWSLSLAVSSLPLPGGGGRVNTVFSRYLHLQHVIINYRHFSSAGDKVDSSLN